MTDFGKVYTQKLEYVMNNQYNVIQSLIESNESLLTENQELKEQVLDLEKTIAELEYIISLSDQRIDELEYELNREEHSQCNYE